MSLRTCSVLHMLFSENSVAYKLKQRRLKINVFFSKGELSVRNCVAEAFIQSTAAISRKLKSVCNS